MALTFNNFALGATVDPTQPLTVDEIRACLGNTSRYGSIMIPEFTWGDLRADAIVLDTNKRWIRGFEIKLSRADFLQDDKWQLYSQFCSSLTLACPHGLITPEEVPKPFGLLYFKKVGGYSGVEMTWARNPKRFQRRDSMAWLWTYLQVLETEFPRLQGEKGSLQLELTRLQGELSRRRKKK